uniref:EamA family transporter n=1 Tax=Deinococcus sp. TaxID=47478 RepID=UPI0025D0758F
AKGLFPALGVAGVSALRVGLGAALLLIIFRPPLRQLTLRQWRAALLYGAALGLMNLSFYFSLKYLPLGLAVTLEFLGPLGLAVASSKRAGDLIWVGLAALGIGLISPLGGGQSVNLVGLGLAMLAGSFWAAYIVIGSRMARHFSGTQGVSVGMLCAALIVVPLTLLLGFQPGLLTPTLLLHGLGIAVLSSALPYTLEMVALRRLPRRLFSIFMSLEPALAAVMGWAVLHEVLSVRQWVAVACVIGASAGAAWSDRQSGSGEGVAPLG